MAPWSGLDMTLAVAEALNPNKPNKPKPGYIPPMISKINSVQDTFRVPNVTLPLMPGLSVVTLKVICGKTHMGFSSVLQCTGTTQINSYPHSSKYVHCVCSIRH